MSEISTIEMVSNPATRESVARDLRRLGIHPGQVVLVHCSLSSLGWVSGGPVAVIQALMDVLTLEGTLMMPAHSGDYSDPALWEHPPVPEAWWETIRRTMPLYDPKRTPTRDIGRVPELFRTWPDVLRSDHPQLSFAAWGWHARFLTEGHELANALGETSPLARLYDLDGSVLLLGVGYDSNTSLHLAEYRAPHPPVFQNGVPWLENNERVWKTYTEVDFNEDVLTEIGVDFEKAHEVRIGNVAAAACRLMSQRPLVDFATAWVAANRLASKLL